MTTILTFIIPALIVVLLSLPLVNVFKGKVTAKSAKMRLGTHICGFFGAVALVLFLTYANSPVLAAGADKMTGSIAQGLGFIGLCSCNWFICSWCWYCRSCCCSCCNWCIL